MDDATRQALADRMKARGGFGSMVARMLTRGRGTNTGVVPPPVTSSRSRSDMFTRARRVKTGAPGQTTTQLAPAAPAGNY